MLNVYLVGVAISFILVLYSYWIIEEEIDLFSILISLLISSFSFISVITMLFFLESILENNLIKKGLRFKIFKR